jgi:hypothetical protein
MENDELNESLLGNESNASFNKAVNAELDLKSTPKSYSDKISLISKLPFGKCFSSEEARQLTRQNLKTFYALSLESDVLFDEENPSHVELLLKLYNMIYPGKFENINEVLRNDCWKNFGFQSANPCSDFRGGGLLSLKAMIYFAEFEDDAIEDIKVFMVKSDSYLFACQVISTVFFLKSFLHFGLYKIYNEKFDKSKTCSQKALKYFLGVEGSQEYKTAIENFFKLVLAIDLKVYTFWKQSCIVNKSLTIIDFKQAETVVVDLFKEMFEDHSGIADEGENISVFVSKFNAQRIDKVIEPYKFT